VLVLVHGLPRGPADLQAIIDAGQGDRPLKDLKFLRRLRTHPTQVAVLYCQPAAPKGRNKPTS
jgi:hypothetical protein